MRFLIESNLTRYFLIVSFLSLPCIPANAQGCGTPAVDAPAAAPARGNAWTISEVPLASMGIETPVYRVDGAGRFFEFDPHKKSWEPVSNHRLDVSASNIRSSADGRWISYSGALKGKKTAQYWIYDSRQKTDKLVLEYPAWAREGDPEFSPSGKMLAIAVNIDMRQAGLYLWNTETSRRSLLRLPTPGWETYTTVRWSKDGDALLISMADMSNENVREYYSYRFATGRVEKISGHTGTKIDQAVFLRNGQEIGVFSGARARSGLFYESLFSPDGEWKAYLGETSPDMSYALKVVDRQGALKTVALGHDAGCNTRTIFITGWIDDQHLVYEDRASLFVFDMATGGTAKLFDKKDQRPVFTW